MKGISMVQQVVVLQGGNSAEREVSLSSGAAVAKALRGLGYAVTVLDAAANDLPAQLANAAPEIVFNALHGRWGEDGCIQGMLEILGIPYTHSGVMASALAMHKPSAKLHFAAAGVPVVEGRVVSSDSLAHADPMPRPFVIKPIDEGSSVGVQIIRAGDAINPNGLSAQVLIERYVAGREIQVAVLDGKALGAIEIRPKQGFYDYEAKYTTGKADHLMPAPIPPKDYAAVCTLAEKAHAALGCRGLTRSDFMYDAQGNFFLLELNTQPGMTPLSLSPEIAAHAGVDFPALMQRIIASAGLDSRQK